jgi:hypothetical protein
VHATDEYVGIITDCYLDGAEWVVRYLVVDISDVILDRLVLVAPYGIERLDWHGSICRIGASRGEVESSPELEVDQPVSRQYEVALHRHYEWPEYWGQAAFIDTAQEKKMPQATMPGEDDEVAHFEAGVDEEYEGDAIGPPEAHEMEADDEEVHEMDFGEERLEGEYSTELRSCREMIGYAVMASDGAVGNIKELLFEDEGYLVRFLVVDTGYHHDGKVVLVPEEWVRTIAWEEKAVHVEMSRRAVLGAPGFKLGMQVTREVEKKLYDYVDHL